MRRARENRGFTLVEVIVALVIMAGAIAILAQGFLAGGAASINAQNETAAAHLASSKMAELEAGILPLNIGQTGSVEEREGWTWDIASEAQASPAGLYRIAVTIRWEESAGERAYRLVRFMRERPAANP